MTETQVSSAMWWARLRTAGPSTVQPGTEISAPVLRLATDREHTWILPDWPDQLRPGVAHDGEAPPLPLERPLETAQVLAACLRCCWPDPNSPLWPGVSAAPLAVISVLSASTHRDDAAAQLALSRARGQLTRSHWLRWDNPQGSIQLGPRVAQWSTAELSTLRELWRNLPAPQVPS